MTQVKAMSGHQCFGTKLGLTAVTECPLCNKEYIKILFWGTSTAVTAI
jgi:hypothetical protein